MATIAHPDAGVTGGVDTHKDIHVAAALDDLGRLIAVESFPTIARELYPLTALPPDRDRSQWPLDNQRRITSGPVD